MRAEFGRQAEALTPTEWNAPTLCDGWRVRDVVAHLILPQRFSPLGGLAAVTEMWDLLLVRSSALVPVRLCPRRM